MKSRKKESEPRVELDLVPRRVVEKLKPEAQGPNEANPRYFLVKCLIKNDLAVRCGGKRYSFVKGQIRTVPNDVFRILRVNNCVWMPEDERTEL